MGRNTVVVDPCDLLFPKFSDIDTGTLFRYRRPWNENNVYMKIGLVNRCAMLNTGETYEVEPDREIVPVRGLVSIQSPV